MSHIAYPTPIAYPPIDLIEAERRADGFIYAPRFLPTLFTPKNVMQLATFERVANAYDHKRSLQTIGSAREYDHARLTHNSLISGQRYSIEYGDVGSFNDSLPTELLSVKPWEAPLLLLTIESINGPTITELLPRHGCTLRNIQYGMHTLDACLAKAKHPGDTATLEWGKTKLLDARRQLMETMPPGWLA